MRERRKGRRAHRAGGGMRAARGAAAVAALLVPAGCPRLDMYDQPRYEALEPSGLFADGRSAREPVPGTIARGSLQQDRAYATGGLDDSTFVAELPMALSRELLERGRERYGIYCAVCHDALGSGRGMVVRRGFKQPPAFTEPRLRAAPAGYFFDVISRGFATMPGYAAQIRVQDRWAIVAYLRALQLAQHAVLAELPAAERRHIEAALAAAPATERSGAHD